MNKGQIGRHYTVVLFANAVSLIFGLLATVLIAHYFGSGREVDALFIALSLPQIIGQIVLSVALVAILPVYIEHRNSRGLSHAQSMIAPVFYAGGAILSGLTIVIMLAAEPLIRLLAPGFNAQNVATGAYILRWLAPMIPLLGLSGILQGIENANQRFARAAWSKPLLTATALGTLWAFASGQGVIAYVWGNLLGGTLGLLWQWHEVWKQGDFRPRVSGLRVSLAQFKTAFGSIFVARVVGQIGVLITGMVASTVSVGAVAVLGYAQKIVSVPFLAAGSFGTILFPALALAKAGTDNARQLRLLWRSVRAMAVLGLVFTIPLVLWAEPLIQFLFERGAFDAAATASAALVLQVLALSIVFVATNTVVGNVFWIQKWFAPRLILEAIAIMLLITASIIFGNWWGVSGLAMATLIEFAFLTIAGLKYVQNRTPTSDLRTHYLILGKLAVLGVAITAVGWFFVPSVELLREWSFGYRGTLILGGMAASAAVFVIAGFVWAIPEIDDALALLAGKLLRRARELDPERRALLPARVRAKIMRTASGLAPRRAVRPTRPESIAALISGASIGSVAADFRNTPRPAGLYDGARCIAFAEELQLAADAACRRDCDMLGWGRINLGRPINWRKDYDSGYVWPKVHHTRVKAVQSKRGADCKFPWEVARCQHWAWLACAPADGDRALTEMLSQFREFASSNPPGVGINYANAMEVGIRAINWTCAFRASADRLADSDVAHLAVEMHAAASHISRNLEYISRGHNTNHYIADLAGLYTIGTMFPALPGASEWYRLAGDELAAELPHQFDQDGMHREGAPAYARLVLEFYLFCFILGRRATDPRVDAWAPGLEAGLDALAAMIYPDGTLPKFGDDDSGRLLVPPGEPPNDYRYLIQIGAALFDRADWKTKAGVTPRPGLEFWLGQEGVHRYAALAALPGKAETRIFEGSGFAMVRTPDTVLAIQGGRADTKAPRAHLHNDLTSFEYFADGVCWITDAGTYEYTRQPVWRNRFRATAAHNVIQIDDREQNRWRPEWLFYLSADALPAHVQTEQGDIQVGYTASGQPAYTATRKFATSEQGRIVRVLDRVEGEGDHRLALGLNLAPLPFTYLQNDLLLFRSPNGNFLLHVPAPAGFTGTVTDGWYSPRFAARERCFRFELTGVRRLPFEINWSFAAIPVDDDLYAWVEKLGCDVRSERVEVRRR